MKLQKDRLPPQPPTSPTVTSRRLKCLLDHTQVTYESGSRRLALDGRELKKISLISGSQSVLLRKPSGATAGCWEVGRREPNPQPLMSCFDHSGSVFTDGDSVCDFI